MLRKDYEMLRKDYERLQEKENCERLEKHHLVPQEEFKMLIEQHNKLIKKEEEKQILENAKPELAAEAEEAFKHLERLTSEHIHIHLPRQAKSSDSHEISMEARDTDYKETFKKLLGHLSPETLADFQARDVEFVVKQISPGARACEC